MLDYRLAGWLATVLVAILLGAWWLRRRTKAEAGVPDERLDTVGGWPPTVTRLLSPAERSAFDILREALPAHIVFSQVPLARFIEVPKRNSYADWLRRVGYQSIDFLICDANAQVLAVVELQPPVSQASPRALKRQARIAKTLKAAKVPLHLWTANSLPSAELARDSILGLPVEPLSSPMPLDGSDTPAGGSAAVDAARRSGPNVAAAPAAAPGRNPFDEDGRDSTQDEFIEAREPPQTTWFDDFDSGPTPLSPNDPRRR